MKSALVCGAGGFIGGHLVKRLKKDGFWVRGVDLKFHEFSETHADDFVIGDLRDQGFCSAVVDRRSDEVYQLAADMGGAGYIFTGEHDADVMHNSVTINSSVLDACHKRGVRKIFYSSPACMYPAYNQEDPQNPKCSEDSAYPAAPDSEYGWEKLFSERLYLAYRPWRLCDRPRLGPFRGLRSTCPLVQRYYGSARCGSASRSFAGEDVEVWGDGEQTRSFLYIDECIEGTVRLLRSNFSGPVNIGSEEMVTINQLVDLVADLAGKRIGKNHVPGPQGVRGRNSDNRRSGRSSAGSRADRSARGWSRLTSGLPPRRQGTSCPKRGWPQDDGHGRSFEWIFRVGSHHPLLLKAEMTSNRLVGFRGSRNSRRTNSRTLGWNGIHP